MPLTTPSPDRYRRRREAGDVSRAQTQQRLLEAADSLFRENGYAGTTVAAIAARAGVAVQTVYLAWGSKRELFRAAGAAAAAASDVPIGPQEWELQIRARLAAAAGDGSSAAYLAAVCRLFTQVAGRTAAYRGMRVDAAAVEPDLAADWDTRQIERRRTMAEVARGIPREGLRPGLRKKDVLDTLWALASPEVFDLMTTYGERTADSYETWLRRTLTAALCA